jgi:hypothetical protein
MKNKGENNMEESLGLIAGLLYLVVAVGMLVFWVMSLIDILKNDFEGGSGIKIVWLLVVFFLQILGAVIYYFIGKKQKVVIDNNDNLVPN